MKAVYAVLVMASVLYVSPMLADPPIYPAEDVTIGGVGETPSTETITCVCNGTAQNDLIYLGDVTADSNDYYATTYDCVNLIAGRYVSAVSQMGLFSSVASLYDYFADPSKIIVQQNNKYYCRVPLAVEAYKTKTGPAPVGCTTLNYSQPIPDVVISHPIFGGDPMFLPLPYYTVSTPDVQMSCTRMVYP